MKPSPNHPREARRSAAEAIVGERIGTLFRRWPMLSGFFLHRDLHISDVAVTAWPGYAVGKEFYEELAQTLADLVDERPEAIELLRGRTFARAFH